MYKIIGADQKEYGPVTSDQIRQWIAEGRANAQTLVQAEGGPDWKPLSAIPEFAEALAAKAGVRVPLTDSPPMDQQSLAAEILSRQAEVQVGQCLSSGWELWKNNLGLILGATTLVWLVDTAMRFIPVFNLVLPLIFHGVLWGGLYLLFIKLLRGQPASVSDGFSGFRIGFVQLLLASIIVQLCTKIGLVCCCVLPGIYLAVAWIFSYALVIDKHLDFWPAMELSRKVATRVWFPLATLIVIAFLPWMLFQIYFQVQIGVKISEFIFPMIQSGARPDPARLFSQMMQVASGTLMLVVFGRVVWLLNLPFACGALMQAYENLFGTRPSKTP